MSGLDEAWAEAEAAALGSQLTFGQYQPTMGVNGSGAGYRAWARWTWDEGGSISADAATPAAALRELAAKLRAAAPAEAREEGPTP